jgi:hypothetical protein
VTWIDAELALISIAAMLSPTTLSFSVLALVIGTLPLRTGFWFYLGALTTTLVIGVAAAFVALVSLFPLALALILLVVARDFGMRVLGSARVCLERRATTIALVIITVVAVTLLRNGIAGLTS